ncbi:hypothetical protein M2145_002922, partial [Lachnospiraceae bacterium PF1-21]
SDLIYSKCVSSIYEKERGNAKLLTILDNHDIINTNDMG